MGSKKHSFDAAKIGFLSRLRKIDSRLDYIRLPEEKTVVDGKPLSKWVADHLGRCGKIEVTDYYVLIVTKEDK